MKRVFVDHAGRIQVAKVTQDELAASLRYWTGAIALTVACFVACCVAAGLI